MLKIKGKKIFYNFTVKIFVYLNLWVNNSLYKPFAILVHSSGSPALGSVAVYLTE